MDNSTEDWDPERYSRVATFNVSESGPILALLAAIPGERILDVGCGDGRLSAQLQNHGISLCGLDSSPAQVEAAKAQGVDAQVGDATNLPFKDASFDAVFSNAALHWVKDADQALGNIARVLRPGGRFVAELGGHGCIAALRTALYAVACAAGQSPASCDPWYFPTAQDYAARMTAVGLQVEHCALYSRPTPLTTSLSDYLHTFARRFFPHLPPEARDQAFARVERLVAPALYDPERNTYVLDYVRLRVRALRPAR